MATNIGIVKFINGTVTAKSADGQIRTLKEGDIVFAGDVVMTGLHGVVVITLNDGRSVNLGNDVEVPFDEVSLTAFETKGGKVAFAKSPLFGPSTVPEQDEGTSFMDIPYLEPEGTPDAGHETEEIIKKFDSSLEILYTNNSEELVLSVESAIVDITIGNSNGIAAGDISVPETEQISSATFAVTSESLMSISIAGRAVSLAELKASNASNVLVTTDEGTLTVTGFDHTTGVVTYDYDPSGISKDHTGGEVLDLISIVAAYTGGVKAQASLNILITDVDSTANPDQATVTEDGVSTSTGNVITGAGDATADAVPLGAVVVGVAVGDTSAALDGSGVGVLLEGVYGSITIETNGSYTYTLNNSDPDTNALSDGDTATDVFTYTIKDTDGDLRYTTVTININGSTDIITVNAPVFDAVSYSFNYAENTPSSNVLGTVSATDDDISDTVSYSITTNVDDGLGSDVYAINSTTGEISLTAAGVASFANNFEAASNAHSVVVRATDGANNTDISVSLNETNINEAPTLDLDFNDSTVNGTGHVTSYALGQEGISIGDLDVSIIDVDSTIQSATITLTNAQTGDLLFVGLLPSGISASAYDSGTGLITLTGSGSLSDYQSAIEAVTFYNANTGASVLDRDIDIVVTDSDGANSNTASTVIGIIIVNAPVFDAVSYSFNYAENTPSSNVLGTVSATDDDISDTVSYSITTNVDDGLGSDVYAINSTTGEISLTAAGVASFANNFEAASNAHSVVVRATDGANNTDISVSLNETNINEAPTLDLDFNDSTVNGTGHVTSYALGQEGISIGDLDVSIIDVDSTIQSATITLTNAQTGDLLFVGLLPSGISASAYDSGTGLITLTGSGSLSDYQSAIEAVTFYNANTGASVLDRDIDIVVTDSDGASSNTASTVISVASNSLSVSSQAVVEEGNSAIFRIELADSRVDATKIILTVSGEATAGDDFYDFGDVSRDIQYESSPGVWSDVLFDGTNYYVQIAESATLNPVTGLPYTHVDIKIKTKADALSDDNEDLILNANIDVSSSGNLAAMANTSAAASTLISELPQLFVSAPTSVTEGSDAIFEIGLSNIKITDTLVQLDLSGDFSALDYDQASFEYSTDDGATWITSNSDIQGSSLSILGDVGVAKSILVKITTITDVISESVESLVLTATTVDAGVSTFGNSASDNTTIIDPIILAINEEKDGLSTGTTSITTTVDPNFNYIKVGDGANGTVVDNGDGTLSYTAHTDFSGSDSFAFTKVDTVTGESFTATAQVNVTAIADAPIITMTINNKVVSTGVNELVNGTFDSALSADAGVDGNWYGKESPGASVKAILDAKDTTLTLTDDGSGTSSQVDLSDQWLIQNVNVPLSEDSANYSITFTMTGTGSDGQISWIGDISDGATEVIIASGLSAGTHTYAISNTATIGSNASLNAFVLSGTDISIDNVSAFSDAHVSYTYDVTIDFANSDIDGSEFIQDSISISGAPVGATFSNTSGSVGTNLGAGNWSFTQAQVEGLKITVSETVATTGSGFTLTATVTSEETVGSSTATSSAVAVKLDTVSSNDVPIIGNNTLIMANEAGFVGTLVDTIDTYFSADGGNVFSWDQDASTLPVIYVDGELVTLTYSVTGTDQGTLTGTVDGGSTTVFTVQINMADGNTTDVIYTQASELLGIKETFDGGIVLPGGGNNDTIFLGFNDASGSASGVNAIVTAHNLIEDTAAELLSPAAEHTVNTNNYYIGVNSNNMNAGQQLVFDFATIASDGDSNTTNKNDVIAMDITLFNFGSEKSGDELFITVLTGDSIATATREEIILTGDPDLTEQHYTVTSSTGGAFIGVEFLAGNESSYKLGIDSISSISYNTDFDMDLAYTITDTDGDNDSGNVVISLDGDEVIVYDASKTAIDAGDEQSSSGGVDTLVFNTDDSINFSLDHPEILNFEALDLTNDADTGLSGAHSLTSITMQDVLDLTDTGNELRVFGDNADTVTLLNEASNTWTNTGTVTEDLVAFDVYSSGAATIKIQESIIDSII
ncbi:MAG: VCBS domain-containing protein [Cycloclasticus sp.]